MWFMLEGNMVLQLGKSLWEFLLWHSGISGILGMRGHRFNPQPGQWVKDLVFPTVAWVAVAARI